LAVERKFDESEKCYSRFVWKKDYTIHKLEKKIKVLREQLRIHKEHIKRLIDEKEVENE